MNPYGTTQAKALPGPEIEMEVMSPCNGNLMTRVTFLVDTAATISVIPKRLIEKIGPLEYRICEVTWGNGLTQELRKVLVDLKIGHQVFREKWVVVCEKPYGLIGRDLLNSYVLTCDGPGAYWKVEPNWL